MRRLLISALLFLLGRLMTDMPQGQSSGMMPENVVNRVTELLAAAETRAIERHHKVLIRLDDMEKQVDRRFDYFGQEHDELLGKMRALDIPAVHASVTGFQDTIADMEQRIGQKMSGYVDTVLGVFKQDRETDLARDWSVRSTLRALGVNVGILVIVLGIVLYMLSSLIQRVSSLAIHMIVALHALV